MQNVTDMVTQAKQLAAQESFAKDAEHLVVVAGVPFGSSGHTNNIRVVRMNE